MEWFETMQTEATFNLCSSSSSAEGYASENGVETECPGIDLRNDVHSLLVCLDGNSGSDNLDTLRTLKNLCVQDAGARNHVGRSGVETLFRFVRRHKNDEVSLEALITLNAIVDEQVPYQSVLCTAEVFQWAHSVLRKSCATSSIAGGDVVPSSTPGALLSPSPLLRDLVYLLTSLLTNNSSAQRLLREHGCLNDLIDLYRLCFPRFLTDIMTSSHPHPYVILWQTINAALGYAVNNPRNEENQTECMKLFPFLVAELEETIGCPEAVMPRQQALCRLLALTLSCNAATQDAFSFAGGLHVLSQCCLQGQRGEALLTTLDTLDAAITDHENNALLAGSLDIPLILLAFIEDRSSDAALQIKAALTLGHCADVCESNRRLLQNREGFAEVLRQLICSDDMDLVAAVKYLLCLAIQDSLQDEPQVQNLALPVDIPTSSKEKTCCNQNNLITRKTASDYWSKESGRSSSLEQVLQKSVQLQGNEIECCNEFGFEKPDISQRACRDPSKCCGDGQHSEFSPGSYGNPLGTTRGLNAEDFFLATNDTLGTGGYKLVGNNVEVTECVPVETAAKTIRNNDNCFKSSRSECGFQSAKGSINDNSVDGENIVNSQDHVSNRMKTFYLGLMKRRCEGNSRDKANSQDHISDQMKSFHLGLMNCPREGNYRDEAPIKNSKPKELLNPNENFVLDYILRSPRQDDLEPNPKQLHDGLDQNAKQFHDLKQYEALDLEFRNFNHLVQNRTPKLQTRISCPKRKLDFNSLSDSKLKKRDYVEQCSTPLYSHFTLNNSEAQGYFNSAPIEENVKEFENTNRKALCDMDRNIKPNDSTSSIANSLQKHFHGSQNPLRSDSGILSPIVSNEKSNPCSRQDPSMFSGCSRRSKSPPKGRMEQAQLCSLMTEPVEDFVQEATSRKIPRVVLRKKRQNEKDFGKSACCYEDCFSCCCPPCVPCRMAQSEAGSCKSKEKMGNHCSFDQCDPPGKAGKTTSSNTQTRSCEPDRGISSTPKLPSKEPRICLGCLSPLQGNYPLLHSRNYNCYMKKHFLNLCQIHKALSQVIE